MRRVGVAVAVFVAATIVGALVGAAIGAREPAPPRPSPALERGHPPVPGTESIDFTTRDPRGGPPLGVLVFRDERGRACAAYGSRTGGRLVRRGRRVVDVPLAHVAACATRRRPPGAPPVLRRTLERDDPATRAREGSTYVWGIAAPGTRSVTVRTSAGVRSARPGRRGAFLVAFGRALEGERTPVTLRTASGRVRRMTIRAALTQAQIERMLRGRRGPVHRGVHEPPPPPGGSRPAAGRSRAT
jgi:hypothetical protein